MNGYLLTDGDPVEAAHLVHLLQLGHELLALAALLRGDVEQAQLGLPLQHLLHHPAQCPPPSPTHIAKEAGLRIRSSFA